MQAALVNGAETRRARNLGLGVWAIVVGLAIAAIYGDSEPVSIGSWGYVAVAATVAAAVWLLLVMRPLSRSEGNTPGLVGFITGIVALAANVVFWIPFAFVLGCGAVLLDGRFDRGPEVVGPQVEQHQP